MSLKKAWATDSAEYGCAKGMKWQYLLNLSTTVSITDFAADPWQRLHKV